MPHLSHALSGECVGSYVRKGLAAWLSAMLRNKENLYCFVAAQQKESNGKQTP